MRERALEKAGYFGDNTLRSCNYFEIHHYNSRKPGFALRWMTSETAGHKRKHKPRASDSNSDSVTSENQAWTCLAMTLTMMVPR